MLKLDDVEFPSKHLNCYEAVLILLLETLGLVDSAPLMGTQAYFVLQGEQPNVFPRYNRLEEEWERVYGLQVETWSVTDGADLQAKVATLINQGLPVGLPVDLYDMSHTPHHLKLHQYHCVAIFGYHDHQYYVVCPYYRFRGWVEETVLVTGLFSDIIENKALVFVPELRLAPLTVERLQALVEESCAYMLGLRRPPRLAEADPERLGVAGIQTLRGVLDTLAPQINQDESRQTLLNLSRQLTMVGHSRHWFQQLFAAYSSSLWPETTAAPPLGFTEVIQLWRSIGMRLGAGVHNGSHSAMEQVLSQLNEVHARERGLFAELFGALPGNESGTL